MNKIKAMLNDFPQTPMFSMLPEKMVNDMAKYMNLKEFIKAYEFIGERESDIVLKIAIAKYLTVLYKIRIELRELGHKPKKTSAKYAFKYFDVLDKFMRK